MHAFYLNQTSVIRNSAQLTTTSIHTSDTILQLTRMQSRWLIRHVV